VIAAGSTVTTEQDPRGLDPGLTPVSGDFDTMDSETAYRDLEQGYRCSEQYAAMQRRYPQLRFWIARCHPSDLVGDPPPQARPPQGSTALNWERSHGES
jgi:hypothetical protein